MTDRKSVLVTGLNGVVGNAIQKGLEEHFELFALSRTGKCNLPEHRIFRGDISDINSIQDAFKNIEVVLHLAADGGKPDGDGSDVPWNSILENNIIGTYNVFESARQYNVKRIVFASSGATISGYEKDCPYSEIISNKELSDRIISPKIFHDSPPRPSSLYGVSKLFGENLGNFFAETYKMSIICIRIGSVYTDDIPKTLRDRAIWCSHWDLTQIIIRSIQAPLSLGFDIFFATSDNSQVYRDLSHAETSLGFIPQKRVRDLL
jgi:nucleoside-diphosphate-sugar epimerase